MNVTLFENTMPFAVFFGPFWKAFNKRPNEVSIGNPLVNLIVSKKRAGFASVMFSLFVEQKSEHWKTSAPLILFQRRARHLSLNQRSIFERTLLDVFSHGTGVTENTTFYFPVFEVHRLKFSSIWTLPFHDKPDPGIARLDRNRKQRRAKRAYEKSAPPPPKEKIVHANVLIEEDPFKQNIEPMEEELQDEQEIPEVIIPEKRKRKAPERYGHN